MRSSEVATEGSATTPEANIARATITEAVIIVLITIDTDSAAAEGLLPSDGDKILMSDHDR